MKKLADIFAILRGVFKTFLFLGMVLILTPVALLVKRLWPNHPFAIPRLFHFILLKLLGIRLRLSGTPSTDAPVLFVSNHTSYLDIPILGSLLSAGFVAKADVADWPLFGFLAKVQNTVFIERRSSRAADQSALLQGYLAKKRDLILFPEGTSSEGLSALPFKSSLFSIVEGPDKTIPVTIQPISVTCVEFNGFPILLEERALYAWYGDMTLVPHLWEVFKRGSFTVDVIFHPPLDGKTAANRKDLAAQCQAIVDQGIHESLARAGLLATPDPVDDD